MGYVKATEYSHADAILAMHVQEISVVSPETLWEFHEADHLKMEIRCYIAFFPLFIVHSTLSLFIYSNGDGFHR